ncbi:MAG: 50S ribosomal protein L29 [Pseudomonadota bacterium]|nr:50S ribosomal protein L29 [Pseudomonadota bacterium]
MQTDLKELSVSELEAKYIDNLKKVMDMKFDLSERSKHVRVHNLKMIRRENARIKTLLTLINTYDSMETESND